MARKKKIARLGLFLDEILKADKSNQIEDLIIYHENYLSFWMKSDGVDTKLKKLIEYANKKYQLNIEVGIIPGGVGPKYTGDKVWVSIYIQK